MGGADWERDPDPTRPVTSVTKLATALKNAGRAEHDFRTLQNKIRDDKLAGGKYLGKARWWVYTDTAAYRELMGAVSEEPITAAADAASPSTEAALAGLIAMAAARENEWRARDRDHQEKIRQLMAASALETERADAAEHAVKQLANALAAVRVLAEKSGQLSTTYRDLLAANYIPDDPGELT